MFKDINTLAIANIIFKIPNILKTLVLKLFQFYFQKDMITYKDEKNDKTDLNELYIVLTEVILRALIPARGKFRFWIRICFMFLSLRLILGLSGH